MLWEHTRTPGVHIEPVSKTTPSSEVQQMLPPRVLFDTGTFLREPVFEG